MPPNVRDDRVQRAVAPHRILSTVALMFAALAGSAGYSYTRHALEALEAPSLSHEAPSPSDTRIVVARFAWFEGNVQVKRAGTRVWVNADIDMVLSRSDLVRTGSGSVAEIVFWNGDVFHVRSDSLVEIEPPLPRFFPERGAR